MNYFRSALSEETKKRHYYFVYTVAFCVTAGFCFSWFLISGKSLIWQMDGWSQHFKALVYYAEYLRNIFRHLLQDHRLIIPDWDFYIGEGSDIVNAMHYYVIGDPIALLSVFVPTRFMQYFYSSSCILRLYLAGISFSALCFGTGRRNRKAVLAGALAYSLCYWGVLNAARHPYFLNPLVYFPLMILGIEKIIRKDRPYLFVATAAVSAASNFYFFAIIALLAVGYAVIRLAVLYGRNVREALSRLLVMGAMAVLGLCIAGILLLPVMIMFLNDSRIGVAQPFHLFYPLPYYCQLPATLIEYRDPYWLCLGMSAPTVLCTALLFVRKQKEPLLKTLLIVCCLITLFPIGGRVLNGMSYMTNRWCWAFVLLLVYIMVKEWEVLFSLSRKEWGALLAVSTGISILIFLLAESRTANAISVLPLFFITLLIVKGAEEQKRRWDRQLLVLLVITVNLVIGAFWKFSPRGENYAAECIGNSVVRDAMEDNEAAVVKSFAEEDYPRYSGTVTQNVNMLSHISNTGYYFSISSPSISDYRNELRMRESLPQQYSGYDDRTTATGLASVDYYVRNAGDGRFLPYGYAYIGSGQTVRNTYDIYQNQFALPLSYCYDACISEARWKTLDPVQKQEIQLLAASTDDLPDGIRLYDGEVPDYRINYTVTCVGDGITPTENGFTSTENSTRIVLQLDHEVNAAELYVDLEGIQFVPTKEYDLYFGDESVDPLGLYSEADWAQLSDEDKSIIRARKRDWDPVKNPTFTIESSTGTSKTIGYKQPDAKQSSGRQDFIANLGYTEEPVTSITISFPLRGIYSFREIGVYAIPMAGYGEKIEALRENTLQNIRLGVDTIAGDISVDENKILCVATPYSKGWQVFVDGEEQRVLRVNDHYIGTALSKGSHTVSFHYSMPLKNEGFIVSLVGMAGFAALIICGEMKRKKQRMFPTAHL